MVWTQVASLLEASVAFQVRWMPAWPVQLAASGASLWLITGALSQLSVAVALPVLAGSLEAPHCSCTLAGQVMTGAVVSTKGMVWTQVASLLQESVAFQVRWMPLAMA